MLPPHDLLEENLQNASEGFMMSVMPPPAQVYNFSIDHNTFWQNNFTEGPVSKELFVLQGAYLSWTGSQWSIRSQTLLPQCSGYSSLQMEMLEHINSYLSMVGKTGKEYPHIMEKVAEMIFIDVVKLLPQHPPFL